MVNSLNVTFILLDSPYLLMLGLWRLERKKEKVSPAPEPKLKPKLPSLRDLSIWVNNGMTSSPERFDVCVVFMLMF